MSTENGAPEGPWCEGGVEQTRIEAAGSVTAHDETGTHVLQQDVRAGGDVRAAATGSAAPATFASSVDISLRNIVAGGDVQVSLIAVAPLPRSPAVAASGQLPSLGTGIFVGRERDLSDIETVLVNTADIQIRLELNGMPGIGKTELARQVAARLERHGRFPGGIFWFDAEQTDLRLQWAELVVDPDNTLPGLDERAHCAVRTISQRAQQGQPVLIVLDNVVSWTPPPSPLPDTPAIRILATTHTRSLQNSFWSHEVSPLTPHAGRELLQLTAGRELEDTDRLLTALDGHVLSIELAATYLREYGVEPAEYLEQLIAGRSPGSSVAAQTSYRTTAESAFRLLWRRVAIETRQAWRLVSQLPSSWFSKQFADAIGIDMECRRSLTRLHLLDCDQRDRYQMHRLLREFALAEMPPGPAEHIAIVEAASRWLEHEDFVVIFQRYKRDADSFTHLLAVADQVPNGARLMKDCAKALRALGEAQSARELLEKALECLYKNYRETQPVAVAITCNELASVFEDMSQYHTAILMFQRALTLFLSALDEDHREVATCRNNLALALQHVGDFQGAQILLDQAQASLVKTLGAGHYEVAVSQLNLATNLRELHKFSEARELLEKTLLDLIRHRGDRHPDVARCRDCLGAVYQDLRDFEKASQLFRQALASDIEIYGAEHPIVATDRNNLAGALTDLKDFQGARILYEKSLASNLSLYAADHSLVATSQNNLASVLIELGEVERALSLLQMATGSLLKTYNMDVNHPRVKACLANLAKAFNLMQQRQ